MPIVINNIPIAPALKGSVFMVEDTNKIQWEPKVPQWKIRRLYQTDAKGISDDDQINDVGWALWSRCDSILTVTAAHYGRVRCVSCETQIERQNSGAEDERITCPSCGWTILWATYHQSYRGKQLFGANATDVFRKYHHAFPLERAANAKMLLIDQLIHAFHVSIREVGRPAAANLIEGSLLDVIRFLDALSNAGTSAAGVGNSREAWRNQLAATTWYTSLNQKESE